MSGTELAAGAAWLLNRVYAPEAFGRRLRAYVEAVPATSGLAGPIGFGRLEMALAQRLAQYGSGEQKLVKLIEMLIRQRSDLRAQLSYVLLLYCQVRFMLDHNRLWDPEAGRRSALASVGG